MSPYKSLLAQNTIEELFYKIAKKGLCRGIPSPLPPWLRVLLGGFHPPYPLAPRFAVHLGSLRGTGGKGDVSP